MNAYYTENLEQRWHSYERPQARRGEIQYRDGTLLAGNRKVASVIIDPALITDIEEVCEQLSWRIGQSCEEIHARIESYNGHGLVLAESIPIETAIEIDDSCLRGVFTRYSYERIYPQGDFGASATVGYCGKEDVHRLGLEYWFDDQLTGTDGYVEFRKDADRRRLPGSILAKTERSDGADIVTSLDPSVQAICEDELRLAMLDTSSDWGCIVVMEPDSGEILGVATNPSYDPNERVQGNRGPEYNVLVHRVVEPGSTIKPLLAAYAIDRGWSQESQRYVCTRALKIDGYTIREAEATHVVGDANGAPLPQIISESSNIGMAQLAMDLGQARIWTALEDYGFFKRTGIELPAEERGLKPYAYAGDPTEVKWPKSTLANCGFGQGFAITPVQLAAAYCVIANGGYLVKPTLLHEESIEEVQPETEQHGVTAHLASQGALLFDEAGIKRGTGSAPRGHRVLSEESCNLAKDWLKNVINGGTGKRAKLARYQAAGKTGTAQIAGSKGYKKGAYLASFAGFFPAEEPQYVVVVMLNNPKGGVYYGGAVAAPVFKAVSDRISYLEHLQGGGVLRENL